MTADETAQSTDGTMQVVVTASDGEQRSFRITEGYRNTVELDGCEIEVDVSVTETDRSGGTDAET